MSGQGRQAREASAEVYQVLRDTREGRHSCAMVDTASEFIMCS